MNAIEGRHLTKTFRLYNSPKDRIWETLSLGIKKRHRKFFALSDINFDVPQGQTVGIIGQNGSGKSTLLQLVCGVLQRTSGEMRTHGLISALLELGAGFNQEFTGRENVYMNGALAGFTARDMQHRLPEIERFAEIGDFIDQPVKTYSTGMYVRLAFSAAINLNPDILVIDEALSVGDVYFQHKCFSKIREFKQKGVTLLFVSHDHTAVKNLCDRVILLDKGRLVKDGPPDELLDHYNALIAQKEREEIIEQINVKTGRTQTRSGDKKAEIEHVGLLGLSGKSSEVWRVGDSARICCRVLIRKDMDLPTVGFIIRDRLGNDIYGTNTYHTSLPKERVTAGERWEISFSLPLHIGPGHYSLSMAVHSDAVHTAENHDWWDNALIFNVVPGDQPRFTGSAYLPVSVSAKHT